MLKKLISGGSLRKSRLHDEKGNFVGYRRFFSHAPSAFFSGLLRLTIGYRPTLPWISFSAIDILEDHLNKSSRVLEFGSGMSTIWYSRHAREVCSVEDHEPWFKKINQIITKSRIANINYKFTSSSLEYIQFMSGDIQGFDLIMIDGRHRSDCIMQASKLLNPGGILYLDNSDKDSAAEGGDMRLAEKLALQLAIERNADVVYFTDFAPTQFFVQQGLLVRVPYNV